jgi:RNA polymerase sigma-32 factor
MKAKDRPDPEEAEVEEESPDGDDAGSEAEGADGEDAEGMEASADDDVLEPELVEGEDEGLEPGAIDTVIQKRTSGRDSGALARHDPLAAYMRDVQRYALLTPEEEHDLAVRYVEGGDLDAARRLVTSNLRLVVKIAYDYRRAYKNLLDLIQEGNIGLMQAVKKFDPYKGVKLSSYAAWWIRAYILRYILNTHRMVKLGTTQAQRKLFFNLQKEKARLSAMGIDPTPETIAERLDVSTEDVVQMDRRMSAGDASLDAPVGGGEEGRPVARIELLPSAGSQADDILADHELGSMFNDKIREFGTTLKGKEKVIFDERLVAEEPKTLQEIGDSFGVSRERVRQIEKRLLGKLKTFLEAELGEGVVEVYEA